MNFLAGTQSIESHNILNLKIYILSILLAGLIGVKPERKSLNQGRFHSGFHADSTPSFLH
jgi:hypothetical protein